MLVLVLRIKDTTYMRPHWIFWQYFTSRSLAIFYSYRTYCWKFSSNILQVEYQMIVLAQTDLRKYESIMGFLAIFYKQKIQPTSLYFSLVSGQLTPFPTHPIFSMDISTHVKSHPMFGTIVINKCILFSFKVY